MTFNSFEKDDQFLFAKKPRIQTIKEWVQGAALAAALGMIGPTLDAHAATNQVKSPASVSKSIKSEKKIPQIGEENPQIYEFLNGNITPKDTLASLQKKLEKRLNTLVSQTKNPDNFSYYIRMEVAYRKFKDKGNGTVLTEAFNQIESEGNSIQYLQKFFQTLDTESIPDMNDALITYYNQVGGNPWGNKEVNQWKKDIAVERKELGYTFEDLSDWINQYEKHLAKNDKSQK